jgi:phosphoribosylformimino-5-aminoimidazole carboxamide ribotide isomerase
MPGNRTIRLIPVLDVMGGVVVRGIGGQRANYRPLVSRLCDSATPVAVAEAIRSHFGFQTAYLADLDAILGGPPAWPLYRQLHERGFRLWVDAGVRTVGEAVELAESGVEIVILGLETIASPDELRRIVDRNGPACLAFSLDLNAGRPMGTWDKSPEEVAEVIVGLGIGRLIVLDLARVGGGRGVGTEPLIAELSRRFPNVELIAGGGVRGPTDLVRLEECGAAAVLVASALHDGKFDGEDRR